jgi:hypothetical protein
MFNGTSPQKELTANVGAGPNLVPGRCVAHGVYLESMVLIASMRHVAEELHDWATRSRSFLVESELFLAEHSTKTNTAEADRHSPGINHQRCLSVSDPAGQSAGVSLGNRW